LEDSLFFLLVSGFGGLAGNDGMTWKGKSKALLWCFFCGCLWKRAWVWVSEELEGPFASWIMRTGGGGLAAGYRTVAGRGDFSLHFFHDFYEINEDHRRLE